MRQAQRCDDLSARLSAAAGATIAGARHRFTALAGKLETLSPLRVLGRGYSLTQLGNDGPAVTHPAQAPVGTALRIRTAGGDLRARSEGPLGDEPPRHE